MSNNAYFWHKTKWFWTHPVWYILLLVFFVNGYMLCSGRVPPEWVLWASILTALVQGFIGSSAMTAIDRRAPWNLSRGYHKH